MAIREDIYFEEETRVHSEIMEKVRHNTGDCASLPYGRGSVDTQAASTSMDIPSISAAAAAALAATEEPELDLVEHLLSVILLATQQAVCQVSCRRRVRLSRHLACYATKQS